MNLFNENKPVEIPKRFVRIWIGKKEIPELFEKWWEEFKVMHPSYQFITVRDYDINEIPENIRPIIKSVGTCAGVSDILRIIYLYNHGGIYVDTDVMPIRPFDSLLEKKMAFLAKRSGKSFESAVIGANPFHPGFKELIEKLPEWYYAHLQNSASVQTGPAFISSVLFGRDDILHLPSKTFYPYNGFMAPKREDKMEMFSDKSIFPKEMIAAHLSNHIWGGRP
jgi:mannosyltransferase OCH1-like enzyme